MYKPNGSLTKGSVDDFSVNDLVIAERVLAHSTSRVVGYACRKGRNSIRLTCKTPDGNSGLIARLAYNLTADRVKYSSVDRLYFGARIADENIDPTIDNVGDVVLLNMKNGSSFVSFVLDVGYDGLRADSRYRGSSSKLVTFYSYRAIERVDRFEFSRFVDRPIK